MAERALDAPAFAPAAIRAVAFDGYGTLFRYHDAEFRAAVTEVLAAQGLAHPDHEAVFRTFFAAYGKSAPWADHPDRTVSPDVQRMLDGPQPPWISTWEIWRRQWTITFDEHHLPGDPDGAASYLRDALAHADAYPDAHDVIEALAARGLTIGLLSNADEDFLQSAVSRGRLRFSVMQSSESLRAYKPHRAVFAALCHRLGFAPPQVLYVGDSPHADVRGADHAGLRTAWVRRSEREYPADTPRPHMIITSLADLIPALEAS